MLVALCSVALAIDLCSLPPAERFEAWSRMFDAHNASRSAFDKSDAIVCARPSVLTHNRHSADTFVVADARLPASPMQHLSHLPSVIGLPASVNWSLAGTSFEHMVRIEDQLWCSSCWAFTTTTVVEAALPTPVQLSAQHLVDCAVELSDGYYNFGCAGGYVGLTMRWVIQNGLGTEKSKPYVAMQQPCSPINAAVFVGSMEILPALVAGHVEYLTEPLLRAMVSRGPTEVVMHAPDMLQFWHADELLTADMCGPGPVNHAVVIVGYGQTSDGRPYWKAANSWGTEWNGDGFFYIERGTDA